MPKLNESWDIRHALTGRLMSNASFMTRETAQSQIDQWIERGKRGGRPDIPMWLLLGMTPVQRFGIRPEDDEIASEHEFLHEVDNAVHGHLRSQVVEVCMIRRTHEHVREGMSFPPGALVGQVPCHECLGTGWWGYGPTEAENGPCVDCKGTGREWVGLA